MDKSSATDISLEDQRRAWNTWNSAYGQVELSESSKRQVAMIEKLIESIPVRSKELIDIGCGSGWLCGYLSKFGSVTGTDLSDEVLRQARSKLPTVKFVSGDFFDVDLPLAGFDVAVAKEVLSHVADQPAFMARVAKLLRPNGHLIIATQNRPVLERWSATPGPYPGQIRHWVDAKQLRALLEPQFHVLELVSLYPVGDQGLLRVVNSYKLNRLLGMFVSPAAIERMKERAMWGHTLMAFAKKR